MTQVRFDGEGCGLGFRSLTGDRNDPVNYMLICSCEVDLGPLGKWNPTPEGVVTVHCERCDLISFVEINGTPKVLRVVAKQEVEATLRAARLASLSPDTLARIGLLRTCGRCADKTPIRLREARCKATTLDPCAFCGEIVLLGDEVAVFALPVPVVEAS